MEWTGERINNCSLAPCTLVKGLKYSPPTMHEANCRCAWRYNTPAEGPAPASSIKTSGMRPSTANLVDTGHTIEKLNMTPRSEERIRIDAQPWQS